MQEMSRRTRQLASLIRDELVQIAQRELNDPRIAKVGMLTFSGIEISPDHRNAMVYMSFMGQEEKSPAVQDALAALASASGFFHRQLLKRLQVKAVPKLQFRFDSMFDKAATINVALKEAAEVEKEAAEEKQKLGSSSSDDSGKYKE